MKQNRLIALVLSVAIAIPAMSMIAQAQTLFKGEIRIAGNGYWTSRYNAQEGETLIISIKTDGNTINEFVLNKSSYSRYLENKTIYANDYYQFNVVEGVYTVEVPHGGEWYVVLANPHRNVVSVSVEISKNVFAQEEVAPEEQAPQVPLFGTISGDVRDVDNNPITNVTVYLTNETIKAFEDAQSAGMALVGPDVSKLFPQPEVLEEAVMPVLVLEEPVTPPEPVVVPGTGEIGLPIIEEAHYVLKNVPPGTYTVNARALRIDGKVISGRAVNVVVSPLTTTIVDLVLDVARPYSMVVSAKPTEISAYLEEIFEEPATVNVTAQLLDYFGQPVGSGYEVTFSADAGTMPLDSVPTDEIGRAVATYIADTPVAGEVLITVTYTDPETLTLISNNTTVRVLAPVGTIYGVVTDGYNKPLAGMDVELYLNGEPATLFMREEPAVAVTNANGAFIFQEVVPNAEGEFYELRVSSDRTGTIGKAKAEVEVGYTITVSIILPMELAPGVVEGQVTDSVGNPVEGAEVSIDGISTVADEEGNFAFEGLYPGDYTVTASAKGETAEEPVTVEENETAYVTIALPIVLPEL